MAEVKDYNDIIEDIFLTEEIQHKQSYEEGFKAGSEAGNPEGYHLGYHRGAELGRELGYYLGIVNHHIESNEKSDTRHSEKIINQLTKVQEQIKAFPNTNSEDQDILGMAETIRAQYKKPSMDSTISKVRHHLDSIIRYLTPMLPIANCHMVEFLTHCHWERLVPTALREAIERWELNDAVERFWTAAESSIVSGNTELDNWILNARLHCVRANDDFCLTVNQLQDRIKGLGGEIKPEIRVKDFMTNKKSYEVQTMSRLVASLYGACAATCCVEAGGGRGHLPVALSLGYGVTSLTVDCDDQTLRAASERVDIIQKQWHAIAKRIKGGSEEHISESINKNLHRFAKTFVTRNTDLAAVVKDKYPEHADQDVKLLLTGLHTCGNLGPDSLRIFTMQPSTAAVFNVPCCYHLLTEDVDAALFDVFQRDFGCGQDLAQGFPMSEHLRGYNLGRNARMLAAQSLERMVTLRQLPPKSLLYRALLQVIIKQHLPDSALSEGKLKRISKCDSFPQYFKMADKILNLELFDSLPEGYLTHVCKDMDDQWKIMTMFYLLRSCLAQVIESVILLDRILFLFENGFRNVFLVKLFDPVLSPRCHSIVAVR